MTYIGLDLGDGDTAVTVCRWTNNRLKVEEQQLDGVSYAIPSWLAALSNSETIIGRNAIYIPSDKGSQASEIHVNFKQAPSALKGRKFERFSSVVVRFCNTLLSDTRCLTDIFRLSDENEFTFCFGHPTGWSGQDVDAYRSVLSCLDVFTKTDEFFARSGVRTFLQLCPESHAALLNLAQRSLGKGVATGSLGDNDLIRWMPDGRYLVVIDWGSSTTDVTSIINRDGRLNIIRDGEDGDIRLGARFIDRAIFRAIVKRMAPRERKRLEEYLEANPGEEQRMISFCRLAKEAYFNATESMRERGTFFVQRPNGAASCFEIDEVFPRNCTAIMHEALNSPVEAFDGRTWIEECCRLLERVNGECARSGSAPAAIFLTGGASRMGFIEELAAKMFPDSCVVRDPFPSTCIASGLALMPYKMFEAKGFLEAVHRFVENEIPTIVSEKLPTLADHVAAFLQPGISALAKSVAYRWHDGVVRTLEGLESAISSGIASYCRSSEVRDGLDGVVGEVYSNVIMPSVNARFEALCLAHNIRPRHLECDKRLTVDVRSVRIGEGIDETIRGLIVAKTLKVIVTSVVAVLAAGILAIADVIAIPIASSIGVAIIHAIMAAIGAIGVFAPVLIPLVALLGLAVFLGGRDALKRALRTADIPHCVRTHVISKRRLAEIVDGQDWFIKNKISEGIQENRDFKLGIVESFSASIGRQIEQEAQDLALHIYN